MIIGVISDTHGLLRPQAIAALQGCAQIIHAGDVNKADLLEALGRIAPTVAVRGNVDRGEWAKALPETLVVPATDRRIYVLHDLAAINVAPAAAGIDVVVFGHSHQPVLREEAGVLYLNPGSAGPRRFSLPVTLAHLVFASDRVTARIFNLLGEPTITLHQHLVVSFRRRAGR